MMQQDEILLLQTFSTCFGRQAPIIRSTKYWHGQPPVQVVMVAGGSSHRHMAEWGSTCNHNYLYRWPPGQYFILLMMGTWPPETCWANSRREVESLYANRSWQPSRSHGTYQHKAITSRICKFLMMGTWLPETCWATIRREIKNTKIDI
jgi:hypothetical protein